MEDLVYLVCRSLNQTLVDRFLSNLRMHTLKGVVHNFFHINKCEFYQKNAGSTYSQSMRAFTFTLPLSKSVYWENPILHRNRK